MSAVYTDEHPRCCAPVDGGGGCTAIAHHEHPNYPEGKICTPHLAKEVVLSLYGDAPVEAGVLSSAIWMFLSRMQPNNVLLSQINDQWVTTQAEFLEAVVRGSDKE